MARPEGFEPPTTWFEARYSIQLSYGRSADIKPSPVSLSGREPDAAARASTVAGPSKAVQIFHLPLDTPRGHVPLAAQAESLRHAPIQECLRRPAPCHRPIQPEPRESRLPGQATPDRLTGHRPARRGAA